MLISFCPKFINLTLFKASFEGVRYIIKQNKYKALLALMELTQLWMDKRGRQNILIKHKEKPVTYQKPKIV